ncbi:hypothetical protein [Sphingobium sp.]|uniref:hypothetical protein n=1 Tax=Sphingobium sp. TaxID=1912891 RepID=UPI002B74DFFD|nr:hypothetical protein [Sphingobium sp.]HUD92307.1 hypothetical protein [Sphingobium sp.]
MTPQVIRDIARKCDDDVAAAIHRNMALVSGGTAMSTVAFAGATSALATAAGAFVAVHHGMGGGYATGEDVADGLLAILRPMVVRSVDRLNVQRAGAA